MNGTQKMYCVVYLDGTSQNIYLTYEARRILIRNAEKKVFTCLPVKEDNKEKRVLGSKKALITYHKGMIERRFYAI